MAPAMQIRWDEDHPKVGLAGRCTANRRIDRKVTLCESKETDAKQVLRLERCEEAVLGEMDEHWTSDHFQVHLAGRHPFDQDWTLLGRAQMDDPVVPERGTASFPEHRLERGEAGAVLVLLLLCISCYFQNPWS